MIDEKALNPDAKLCRWCIHWKPIKDEFGMCQCPSEATYRGSAHGKGWTWKPLHLVCDTGDFSPARPATHRNPDGRCDDRLPEGAR